MREMLEAIGASINYIRNSRVEVECEARIEDVVRMILKEYQYVVIDSCDYNGKRSLRAV